jgi:hypothetical protein
MHPNQRKLEESQKQYKERLRSQNSEKRYVKVLWASFIRGTYIRRIHGELDN